MKTFRILAALVMAVVCVSLSSCSKDDDNSIPIDNTSNTDLDIRLLYGSWVREYESYNGNLEREVLVFNTDMTWKRSRYIYENKESEEGYTFTFYKDTRVLALKDNENDDTPTGYTIIELTNSTFIWLDDENLFTYKRQ